ncbi:hypothetical protein BC832DRAFT_564633, partial [Gaertneriomyces semiglobifer]
MGVLAIVLFHIGVSLVWVYLLMGVLLSPTVFPIAFTLCWKKLVLILKMRWHMLLTSRGKRTLWRRLRQRRDHTND